MREIEGIEQIVQALKPHWDRIEAHFEAENKKYIALMGRSHDVLGRVLKCHLVVESYIDRFLESHLAVESIRDVRLSFHQKAKLLPSKASPAAFMKPGIIRLNTIRNRFGHDLSASVNNGDLFEITEILNVARPGVEFAEPVQAIEAFTTVACTWLIIAPPGLEEVFSRAFSHVRVDSPPE